MLPSKQILGVSDEDITSVLFGKCIQWVLKKATDRHTVMLGVFALRGN
jgi:hypothetical protein